MNIGPLRKMYFKHVNIPVS